MEKNKKKICLIALGVIALIVIVVIMFFVIKPNKELVMYKYNDMIYDHNHDSIEGIEQSILEKKVYKCRYEKCGFIINDDWLGQRGIKQNWIIIKDSKKGTCEGNYCYVDGGNYFLYNVETKKKIRVNLQNNDAVKDVWLENDNPVTLIVNRDDRDIIIDVKNGKIILDTNDIMYGSEYSRNLEIVKKGSQSFYALTSNNHINVMLYDANFNFMGNIDSLEYLDTNANLIDFNYNDNGKAYFKVYDRKSNLVYTSKTYDELFINSGYIFVKEKNNLMIMNSEGKIISNVIEISDNGYFTTNYNKYYPKENGISIFEIEYKNDNEHDEDNIKNMTQYFYNFNTKKIEKYSIDANKFKNEDYDFKVYYQNGYDTSKIGNVSIYIDKDISNEYNVKVNDNLKEIYNNCEFLFSTNSNIYVYTGYHFNGIRDIYSDFYSLVGLGKKLYKTKNIFITPDILDDYSANRIIWNLAGRYYSVNENKLKNNTFKSLQEKYQERLECGSDEEFFATIIECYYCEKFNISCRWNWTSDGFEDISDYIEKYVAK